PAPITVPSASIPAARQNRSKLARTSANASSTDPVAGEPAGVISLVMALLSFVESAPRAYRLKVGNADLVRNSTEPGTSPREAPIMICAIGPLSMAHQWRNRSAPLIICALRENPN